MYLIVGRNPIYVQLLSKAQDRMQMAHRPRTVKAYYNCFKTYLAFNVYIGSSDMAQVQVFMAFLEFLAYNNLSHASILNYVSALKHYFKVYHLNHNVLDDYKIHLMLRAMSHTLPYSPKHKGVFDVPTLKNLIANVMSMPNGQVYRAVFLLAFFGFFRLSNLVPHTLTAFDLTRHLARGDIIFAPPGAHIILKWAKNMQSRVAHRVVQIPYLGNSICPVTALQVMFYAYPASPNFPLFYVNQAGYKRILTDTKVRRVLASLVVQLGLSTSSFGFHTFRRSGASLAFQSNTMLQDIQSHGGWRSQAIWTYLSSNSTASVANTFQSLLST